MTLIKLTSISLCLILFSGCSIKQEVKAITPLTKKEICIIEDPAVRQGFLATYTHELSKKGYKT